MSFNPFIVTYAVLAMTGLTILVVWGSIFGSLRFWLSENMPFFYDMVSCGQCLGFWVGLIGAWVLQLSGFPGWFWIESSFTSVLTTFITACVVSLFSTIVSRVLL